MMSSENGCGILKITHIPTPIVLAFVLLTAGSCLFADRAPKKCDYMVLKNPAIPGPGTPECHEIGSKLTQTAEFKASYKFVRLVQSYFPPDLTLVVVPKTASLPAPLLIRSGKAGEKVFRPVKHTVDYGGATHRYTFGRFAPEAIERIREGKEWPFNLILAIDRR